MVQWKVICGLVTLCVVESVTGSPMQEDNDNTDVMNECIVLDADHFTGAGKEISGTATRVSCVSGTSQGLPPSRRRLEIKQSKDMQKLEAFFGTVIETDFKKLSPKCVRTPTPWPSGYWPVYADSINFLWNKKSNISASEKYARSFGHDVKTFMDKISATRGIDSMIAAGKKPCTDQSDCKELPGNVCAIRTGKKEGCCVPKWPGICHAWAPAAILEPEPICPVEFNGVTFEPFDIKALLTMTYDGSKIPTVFTGKRFSGDDKLDGTDQYGRFLNENRRDLNPAFLHIAAINILDRFNSSFVIDISAGNEVWNQPVSSFEVVSVSSMSPADAAKKYFNVDTYPFNNNANMTAIVTSHLTWIVETGEDGPIVSTNRINKFKKGVDYQYILELDDTDHILGGEWIGKSAKDHPDFLWLPTRTPDESLVTPVGLVYSEVKELLKKSIEGDCRLTSPNLRTSEQTHSVARTESLSAPSSTTLSNSETPTEAPLAEASPGENRLAEAPAAGASAAGTPLPAETPPTGTFLPVGTLPAETLPTENTPARAPLA